MENEEEEEEKWVHELRIHGWRYAGAYAMVRITSDSIKRALLSELKQLIVF